MASRVEVVRDSDPGDLMPNTNSLALAKPSCRRCSGSGAVVGRRTTKTCACVYRRIFRACLTSYHHCQASIGSAGAVQYERVGHAQGRCAIIASFKRAEYAADFIMLATRVLASRPVEWAVFEAYHILALEWMAALPHVNRTAPFPVNRGRFFHAAYRAEDLIGRAIAESRPYSLFPPRAYFAGFTLTTSSLILPRVRSH